MKNLYFLLLSLLFTSLGIRSKAQLISTPDTTICPNTSVTLQAATNAVSTPTTVTLTDDWFTPAINIGFTFSFFGNNYTQCVISSNGYISFNTSEANSFSPYVINTGIPGNPSNNTLSKVANSIMGQYTDLLPITGTTISYATVGTAPTRQFIVSFCDIGYFSCQTNARASFQIKLYESSNNIEVHLANTPSCSPTWAWNAGRSIEGIQNQTGTVAYPVPGRNSTFWTAFHDSYRWTPNSPTMTNAYTLSSIFYAPMPNTSVITWLENGVTPIGVGNSVTVTPTANTFYVARIINCSDTLTDTVNVTLGGGPNITNSTFTDPTTCGDDDGTITLYGLDASHPYIVKYKKDNITNVAYNTNSTAAGEILIPGLPAGSYDSIYVYEGLCFSNKVGPIVLTDPPLVADFSLAISYGCDEDTVSFTNLSTTVGNLYYRWDFGDFTIDTVKNPAHIYTNQGVYDIRLIATNLKCADTITKQVDTQHPLDASFTVSRDSICQHESVEFTNTSVTTIINNIAPTYYWDFGDGGSSTLENPIYTFDYAGEYVVTQYVTDFVPCTDTAKWLILVDSIPSVNITLSDSSICEGQKIEFSGEFLEIGNTSYYWEFGDGYRIDRTNPISHAYDEAPQTFTVRLTATYRICPDAYFEKSLVVKPFPRVDLGPDTTICPDGKPIRIVERANANPQVAYLWNTGETGNSIIVRNPGVYAATLTLDGCSAADSMQVFKDCYLDIPNSFTPNDDGVTDYFLPRQLLSRGVTAFEMTIYNRWGQKVFETRNIDGRGWDGRLNGEVQPAGVYIYMISATFSSGATEKYQGNVTLLR